MKFKGGRNEFKKVTDVFLLHWWSMYLLADLCIFGITFALQHLAIGQRNVMMSRLSNPIRWFVTCDNNTDKTRW